uniref:BACK domain-containing protein n=1 Tax=Mesocestoides corti TaxID=53468 RepID=A0A5K3G0F5_MESCO
MEPRERLARAEHSTGNLAYAPSDRMRRLGKLCDARILSNLRTSTKLETMATELTDGRLASVSEGWTLRAIAEWYEARGTTMEEGEQEVNGRGCVDILKDLVASVDFSKVTEENFVDFTASDCWVNLPKDYRDFAADAWKKARARLPSKDFLVAFSRSADTFAFASFEWTGEVVRLLTSPVPCDEEMDVILRRIVPEHTSYTFAALGG